MLELMLSDPPKQDASNSFKSRSASDVGSENSDGSTFEQLVGDQEAELGGHEDGSDLSTTIKTSEDIEDVPLEQAGLVEDDVLVAQEMQELPRDAAELSLVNFERHATRSLDQPIISMGRPLSEIRADIAVPGDQKPGISAQEIQTIPAQQSPSTQKDGAAILGESRFLRPAPQQELRVSGALPQTPDPSRVVTAGMAQTVSLAAEVNTRPSPPPPLQTVQRVLMAAAVLEAKQATGSMARQAGVLPGAMTSDYPGLAPLETGSASKNAVQLGPMQSARPLAVPSSERLAGTQERLGPTPDRGLGLRPTPAQGKTAQRGQQPPSVTSTTYAQPNIEGVIQLADQEGERDFGRPLEQAQFFAGQTQLIPQPLPPGAAAALLRQLPQFAHDQRLQNNDILLNPEELGRVRLNVQASDASVHLSIMVERPETLDLIRRHINLLTAEYRSLGYHDVSFEFSQDQKQGGQQLGDKNTEDTSEPAAIEVDVSHSITPRPHQIGGSLDLRI